MTEIMNADVTVRPATFEDRPAVERLWHMFRHALSEFTAPTGLPPAADGTFRSERVVYAFTEPGWAPYLLTCAERPAGFAFVRGLDGPVRVLNSFFVVRGARRRGIGWRAVREVLTRHPGPWEIAFQQDNPRAVSFWPRVAGIWPAARGPASHGRCRGSPELPADMWISFTVAG